MNTTLPAVNSKSTVVKGLLGFGIFTELLAPLALSIETPCEGFAVIQLGRFKCTDGGIAAASIVALKVGGEHPQHKHEKSDATFHFCSGRGYVILGENQEQVPYEPGTVIEAPRGTLHGFMPLETGIMLATQKGEPIIGEDGSMDIEYTDRRCFSEHGTVGG